MKKTLTIALMSLLLTAAVLLGGCSGGTGTPTGGTAPTGAAQTVDVTMENFAFNPASVEVGVGGSVTWTNKDSAPHTVDGDGLSSGQLAQGESYTKKFDTAGTFNYTCSIHPAMTGTVVVK